jgi:hypothetical protein
MTERDPIDRQAENEADAAAAEAGAIGGRAPADEDPERRPVEEAGGGESEGFERAEQELVEQASHDDPGTNPKYDEFAPEAESDRETIEHGEPDQPLPGERDEEPS